MLDDIAGLGLPEDLVNAPGADREAGGEWGEGEPGHEASTYILNDRLRIHTAINMIAETTGNATTYTVIELSV